MKKEILFASNICAGAQRGADLKNLTLSLLAGEILGIFGNRYSGKGALFRVINGELPVSAGEIIWNGTSGTPRPATVKIGKFSRLIDEMQIWENVALLWEKNASWGILDSIRTRNMIRLYFQDYRISMDVSKKAGTLSQIDKIIVEVLVALRQKKKILLIDLAGVEGTVQEYTRLKTLLLRAKDAGASVIVFGHQLETVSYLSDRVAVICNGRIVKQWNACEISAKMIEQIKTVLYPTAKREKTRLPIRHECIMRVKSLDARLRKPVTFDLYRGEFAAVVSPQLELFQSLYDRIHNGIGADVCKIEFQGRPETRLTEKKGIYFLNTQYLDRLIDEMTPLENLCLGITDKTGAALVEHRKLVNCIAHDFYEWYGHEGMLGQKDSRQLTVKDRIAINLFRLRFLKIKVLFCNALNVHNDLLTYQMVEDVFIAMTQNGTTVCLITNDFAYYDEMVERYIVLGEGSIRE